MNIEYRSNSLAEKPGASPWSVVNVVTATISGYLIAVMTAVLVWKSIAHDFIVIWLTVIGVTFIFGVFQAIKYQRNQQGIFKNEFAVVFASILFGLLWSVPGNLLILSGDLSSITMYLLTVILMLSWGSIYFSTIKYQFIAFSVPFTLPLILQLLSLEQDAVVLGGVIASSLVIMTICTRTAHYAVQDGINSLTNSLPNLHYRFSLQFKEKQKAITEVINSEQHMRELVDATFEGIMVIENGRIIEANKTLADMIGILREDVIGNNIFEYIHESSTLLASEKINGRCSECFEISFLKADGSVLPVELRATNYDYKNFPVQIIAVRDITSRKEAEKDILRLSNIDLLTGLPNRKQVKDTLVYLINEAKIKNKIFAFLIVDVDNFKLINETLGHEVGDELLQYVSLKISETVRDHDLLARWGDDEFAIILNKIENDDEIFHITKRIQQVLCEFIVLNGHEIYASVSIGYTTFTNVNQSLEELISNAEVAVSRAKEKGHNSIDMFTRGRDRKTSERYELENDLRKAIENSEFVLHYQPKINLSSCKVTGVEALIRWRHPTKGLISPLDFIPLAEKTGMIVPIGAWVLDEACRQINTWKELGLESVPIAVNLSLRQLKNVNMLDVIMSTLARHRVKPELIEIEITESSVAENYEKAVELMNGLSAAGITISIDDFGTGYSSLSYLKKFPVDYLKIDRSFIRYIPDDVDDTAITTTIIMMAENLGLKVIAEGVETQEQLNFIQKKGCYSAQGYLISKPLPEKYITEWLHTPPTTFKFDGHGKRGALHQK